MIRAHNNCRSQLRIPGQTALIEYIPILSSLALEGSMKINHGID
jgi:hypothetical protein